MNRFRLTTTRECRVLTPIGWGTLSIAFGLVLVSIILFVHPFLAPIRPVEGEILVIAGGLQTDYALKQVKDRFQKGSYKFLVIIGNNLKIGHPLAQNKNLANWTASRLKAEGVLLKEIIQVSITFYPRKDRTYHKALEVKKKLKEMGLTPASIDVVSLGVHARRTWILFEKAFPSVNVGIISIQPNDYDPTKWWFFSAGVRNVISETVAYLYARLIFNPPI